MLNDAYSITINKFSAILYKGPKQMQSGFHSGVLNQSARIARDDYTAKLPLKVVPLCMFAQQQMKGTLAFFYYAL